MNISNFQRILKLSTNLVRNPDLFLPWLRTSVFSRRLPISYPLPWWSFRAIEAADKLVSGRSIFEYGSGGSTLRFAKAASKIRCVEDSTDWLAIVQSRLKAENISNVELLHRPFDFRHPVGFENSDYLKAIGIESWDIVIIDGQDWTFRERLVCFDFVEPTMKQGSVLILDDFWRYTEVLQRTTALKVDIFESVGPCRLGVTSTAFFYY